MSVTLELKPGDEARAVEQAVSQGMPVENFLESVIGDGLNGGEGKSSYQTSEEWKAALAEFAGSPASGRASALVDDSSESIYQGKGDYIVNAR
jgi:hypothetical protein